MSEEIVSKLISHMMTAISSCALYSETHPVFKEFSGKALKCIKELYRDDSFSLLTLENSLIFNDIPFAGKGMHINSFFKSLKKKKIEKILFRNGLEIEELQKFLVGMASRDVISSSPHLSVGIVEVKFKSLEGDVSTLMNDGISKFQEVCHGISRFKRLDMVGLEDAVISFISTVKKEMNVLRIVSPVKNYNEYTYVHAANVSVLTIFQAESLGMKGEILHDIGLAGLLHDVGKMFVSSAVLDKQSKLDDKEWADMKKHPIHGALYLSKLQDVPPLTIIAAFEHHMKFDGSGYPETRRCGRKQHIVSQMVAIADFFDALRTERPYRKPLDVPSIVGLMRAGVGKDFNPVLVDSFLLSLTKVVEKF